MNLLLLSGCAVIRKSDYKWSVSDCNIDESAFICTKNQSPDQAPRLSNIFNRIDTL